MTMKLQFVIEAVDKATGRLQAINRAVDGSIDRIFGPARKLRAAVSSLVQESGIEKVGAAWSNLKERIAKLPMVAAISVGGAFAVLHRTIDAIDRTVDASRKLNIPIRQFQQLGFAASMNGSSEEEMAQALTFLSSNMVDALSGSKEMQLNFARLGITMDRLRKMNALQVFESMADTFHRVGDAGQNAEKKISIARAMMGRSGADLVQFLNMGSAAFKSLYAEADHYGTLSDQQAEGFKTSADNIKRFQFSLQSLLAAITSAALPGLDAMIRKVTEMNATMRMELSRKVGEALGEFIRNLPKVLTALGQISKAVISLINALDWLADKLGGWDTLLAIFGGAMMAKALYGIYTLTTALWGMGAALLATPFGWVVAAIAAVAVGALLIYKNWGGIKKWFIDLWQGVLDKAQAVADFFRNMVPPWLGGGYTSMEVRHSAIAAGAALPSAVAPPGGSLPPGPPLRQDLGGTLKIEIDGDGRPRVRELRQAPGSALQFDVYTGPQLAFQ